MSLPTSPHTGVSWSRGTAGLRFSGPGGDDEHVPVAVGETVSWRLPGTRQCIGVWIPATRRQVECPQGRLIPTARTGGQCDPCDRTDPGKALARGHALDDPRPYRLYLAYFGPGLVKVGLTAAARDADRLTEQGALAYTWLAAGPLRQVRRAELAASASKLATERVRHRTKVRGRWQRGYAAGEELEAAHRALADVLAGLANVDDLSVWPCEVTDLREVYGLNGTDRPEREVTDIEYGACLTGTVTCLVGQDAVLATDSGTLLVDMRLLVGRTLTEGGGAPVEGVETAVLELGKAPAPQQDTLF